MARSYRLRVACRGTCIRRHRRIYAAVVFATTDKTTNEIFALLDDIHREFKYMRDDRANLKHRDSSIEQQPIGGSPSLAQVEAALTRMRDDRMHLRTRLDDLERRVARIERHLEQREG